MSESKYKIENLFDFLNLLKRKERKRELLKFLEDIINGKKTLITVSIGDRTYFLIFHGSKKEAIEWFENLIRLASIELYVQKLKQKELEAKVTNTKRVDNYSLFINSLLYVTTLSKREIEELVTKYSWYIMELRKDKELKDRTVFKTESSIAKFREFMKNFSFYDKRMSGAQVGGIAFKVEKVLSFTNEKETEIDLSSKNIYLVCTKDKLPAGLRVKEVRFWINDNYRITIFETLPHVSNLIVLTNFNDFAVLIGI